MFEFNQEQVKGISERVAALIIMWLLARGYITEGDAATITMIIVGMASVGYGWWINKKKSLVKAVANTVPNTTIVTTPAIALNTPEQNIVPNTDMKVVEKV